MLSGKMVSNRAEVLSQLQKAKEAALTQCGQLAEAHARELCPVDTGRLRDSIHYEVTEEGMTLAAYAPYAEYVELGTHRTAPQPFLRPAMEQYAGELEQAIRAALGD